MVDILKGVAGTAGNYVLGWVMPLTFAVVSFVFLVLQPAGLGLGESVLGGEAVLATVGLALAVLAGGLVLSALAGHLYRFLEGYSWPSAMRVKGIERQKARKQRLQRQLALAGSDLERELIGERLDRFPTESGQIAPTSLGNAIRAFERFGVDRYRLDSQAFWVELTTVAPGQLRTEIGRARASVDFFVAQVYLAAAFGAAALVVWLREPHHWSGLAGAIVAWLAVPLFFQAAVASTTYWRSTVRALVNLGRVDLAARLGLALPATLADERLMWERLAGFNYYPFDESWVSSLDDFRVPPQRGGGPPAGSASLGAPPANDP